MSVHNLSVVMTGNATSLKGALMAAGRDVDTFKKKVDGAGKTGMGTAKLMGAAFLTAGAAVAVGLGYAVAAAAKFDTQMRNVQSITKMSEREFRATSAAVIDLSRKLPQSAATLAEGLYDIASSGFAGADGLEILEVSAKAASAGMTETAVASKAIVAVLNAYGLEAGHAADVSDILFQAVNLGVLSFEELSGTIGDVVGTAAAATVGIDEVASAIATMTLSGISAAEAGTSLNRTMQSILDPSDELAAAIKGVGYESGVQALQVDTLDVVMGKLQKSSQGNIDTLMKWFPEIRAARGALALMAANGENYRRVVKGIQDAEERAGSTQAALNEQMKSLSMQWQLFVNRINAGVITLGQKLLPVVIDVLGWITKLAKSGFSVLAEAVRRLEPFWQALVQIGGNVVGIFEDMWEAVGPAVTALAGIAGLGVITALNLIGEAVAAVTQFLADHHDIATAIAILYATKVVTGFVTAGKAAQMYAKAMAMLKLTSVMSGSSLLLVRLSYVKDAFASLFAQFSTGPGFIANMKNAFSGLGGSLVMGAGIGLVVAEVAAVIKGLDNAKQKAREFVEEASADIELNNIEDMRGAISTIGDELDVQRDKLGEYDEGWGGLIGGMRGVLELVTPMENGLLDSAVAIDELGSAIDRLEVKQQRVGQIAHTIGAELGVFAGDVKRVATELGIDLSELNGFDPDPQKLAEFTAEIGKAILLGESSPKLASIGAALDTIGDSASTNTEKVDAFKSSLDRLMGIPMDVFSATTDAAQAMNDLGEAFYKNGANMNQLTEAGAENRDQLIQTTEAQKDLAQAIASEHGIQAGVDSLMAYRDQLAGVLSDAGFTESQVGDLLAQMGLAPEDIEFLVSMTNESEAKAALQGILDKTAEVDGTTAEPKVVISGIPDATSDLSEIQRRILGLPNKTVTITVQQRNFISTTTGLNTVAAAGRWGMVTAYARGGITPAHVTDKELLKYGEPETGGEAYIPRKGNPYRSMAVLEEAASWYGASVVKQSFATGGLTAGMTSLHTRNAFASTLASSPMGAAVLAGIEPGDIVARTNALRDLADQYYELAEVVGEAQAKQALFAVGSTEDFDFLSRKMMDLAAATKESADRMAELRKEQAEFRTRANDIRFMVGAMPLDRYLEILNGRLLKTKLFSEEWYALWKQIGDLQAEVYAEATQALEQSKSTLDSELASLNSMLDEAAGIRKRIADNTKSYNEAILEAERRFNDDHTELIEDRVDSLETWANASLRIEKVWGNTAGALSRNIAEQTQMLTDWSTGLAQLRQAGLSQNAIDLLGLEAGPEALGQVEALLAGSAEDIARLNAVVAERQVAANTAAANEMQASGSSLATSLRELAEEHAERLQDMHEDFVEEQAELADQLAQLGKESGRSFADAIAEGLASGIPGIVAQVEAVQAAMASVSTAQGAVDSAPPPTDPNVGPAGHHYVDPNGSHFLRLSGPPVIWIAANGPEQIAEVTRLYGSGDPHPAISPSRIVGNIPGFFGMGGIREFETAIRDAKYFAKGGVFTQAWSGFAHIGENAGVRPEILTPEKLMRDVFASELRNQSSPVEVTVVVDGKIIEKVVTDRQRTANRQILVRAARPGALSAS